MATIISYTNDKATRSRLDCLGEFEPVRVSVTNESNGVPVFQVITKDEKTGRIFRVNLSQEETEAMMRIAYRSGAYGMAKLRAKFEPVGG